VTISLAVVSVVTAPKSTDVGVADMVAGYREHGDQLHLATGSRIPTFGLEHGSRCIDQRRRLVRWTAVAIDVANEAI